MLHSVRSNVMVELDAAVETHAAIAPSFRLHAFHARNVVLDDALFLRAFDRRGQLGRSVATCVLEGEALVRTADGRRLVKAGEAFTLAQKSDLALRCEGSPAYRTLVFEWDDAEGVAATSSRTSTLDGASLDVAERLHQTLRLAAPSGVPALLAAHVANLARLGIAVTAPTPEEFERVPPRLAQISAVLDRQLSQLDAAPMAVDLESELGLSTRQLSRLVRELNERYGFNADGWIDVRNRRRTMLGAALLTAPGARVATVARAVGYSSAQVMARAFAAANLPAPRDIAAAVQALRPSPGGAPPRRDGT